MDILEKILLHDNWLEFLRYKKEKGHMSKRDEEDLTGFIENKEYIKVAKRLNEGGFFSLPTVSLVNKRFSDKKRTVFTFSREENYIQKLMAYFLLDYDWLFCDNLYSFRKDMGVKKAITRLVNIKDMPSYYSYKLDISDYFNSVDASLILPRLEEVFADQPKFLELLHQMLTIPYAIKDDKEIMIKKGIMAGCPLSGFLANLFVTDLDKYFEDNNIIYARYSDDIIFFAETKSQLQKYIDYVNSYLKGHGLNVNQNKVYISKPHSEWTFLGFSYTDGVVDIAQISVNKLKKKMKRKARALYRWKIRKGADDDRAVHAYIRYFNQKLFANPVKGELTWSRWYFPIINSSKGLAQIDRYMQQCARYIASGKYSKTQYNYRYEDLKKQGYISLVNAFYNYRKEMYKSNNTDDAE